MRERTPASAIRFDAPRATWTFGDHQIRADLEPDGSVRFALFSVAEGETPVGSYSGKVGTTPAEVAQYLVYFLETGKPWHQGMSKKQLT